MIPRGYGFGRYMKSAPSLAAANALFFISAAGAIAIKAALALLLPDLSGVLARYLPGALYELCLLALPVFVYMRSKSGDIDARDSLRLYSAPASKYVLAVLAAILGVPLVNSMNMLWITLWQFTGMDFSGAFISGAPLNTPSELALALVFSCALPGICEELAFRGLIMRAWESYGERRALVVSAALFVALHGTFAALPSHLMLALVIGAITLSTGSLYVGIIYHAAHNATIAIAEYISRGETGAASTAAYADLWNALGGGVGFASLMMQTVLLGAIYALLIRGITRDSRVYKNALASHEREGMGPAELTLLIAGILTATIAYALDILQMYGLGAAQ